MALLAMTLIWGGTFTATRWTLVELSVWQLLAMRFTIATALAALWWRRSLRFAGHRREWLSALWLGGMLGVGYVAQTIGLQTTTVPRSAFLTSLTVLFVPLIQVLIWGRAPARGTWVGIGLALVGLWLLLDPSGGQVVAGDLWTILCAIAWSVYIIDLGRLSGGIDLGRLVVAQCGAVAAACWLVTGATGQFTWEAEPSRWSSVIYLGVLGTFLTTAVQSRVQRETTAARAALIFCAEPVFAAAIAWIVLAETLALGGLVGAGLILAGIVLSEVLD